MQGDLAILKKRKGPDTASVKKKREGEADKTKENSIFIRNKKSKDVILKTLMYIAAVITVALTAIIIGYVLIRGIPHISVGFITNTYSPIDTAQNGVLPMILNTLYITALTLLIAVPVGVCAAVYLTEYTKKGPLVKIINFTTEVLAGIPSIIFGLFGYTVFCIMFNLNSSIIAGSLTMAVCILPTVIRTTQEALRSVPKSYTEGARALGAGKFRAIRDIQLPAAMPGIITGVILAIGRIVGESAALLFTSGLGYNMPSGGVGGAFEHILESGRTLTLHLYSLAMDSSDPNALNTAFATGAVLLIIVFILNRLASFFSKTVTKKHCGS